MKIPILKTKINIPPARANLLPRPEVFRKLDVGAGSRLVLIAAPAGYGKTTLLGEWARRKKEKLAWVSLDENDNDLGRFLAHVVAALQVIYPKLGELTLSALQSTQQPTVALTALINDIESLLLSKGGERRLILVLDDYHAIDNQDVHAAMEYFFKNLPNHMQIIVTSRATPGFSVSRLRADGLLTELQTRDLQLTPYEVSAFFNQILGLNLPPDVIAALDSRIEGWIAGLQLAALSIQERGGHKRDFFDALTGSHRHILDYLTDEVIKGLPEKVRSFLFQTSILSELTGDLCEYVCDFQLESSGREILERLDQMNAFIMPIDDERRWFRYHHIFSDVLSARLKMTSPAALPYLHQRASEWYEKHGRVHDAIKHALDAGNYPRAAALIENTDPANMVLRGEVTTILKWLDALPEDLVRAHPRLSLSYAWALFIQGKLEEIEPRLQITLLVLNQMDRNSAEGFLGEVAALRAWVALEHDNQPHKAIELAQQALNRLPKENTLMNGALYSLLGDAHSKIDQIELASESYRQAINISKVSGHEITTLMYLTDLARLQIAQGRLRDAEGNYRVVLEAGGRHGSLLLPGARAMIGLGIISYQRNDLDKSRFYLEEGIGQCEAAGYLHVLTFGYITLARVMHALSHQGEVQSLLKRAADLAHRRGMQRALFQVEAFKARLAGQVTPRQFAETVGIGMGDDPVSLREIEYLTLAELAIKKGDKDSLLAAVGLLYRMQEKAEGAGRRESLIEILALQSLAFEKVQPQAAAVTLTRALQLADAEGQRRVFLDLGRPMADLLRRVVENGLNSDFAAQLLGDFLEPQSTVSVHQHLPEPLSKRELDVLRLLAAGLSNQEIADKISVSPSTVNTHTNTIYQKLNVHSRAQAVLRAKSLGLL